MIEWVEDDLEWVQTKYAHSHDEINQPIHEPSAVATLIGADLRKTLKTGLNARAKSRKVQGFQI